VSDWKPKTFWDFPELPPTAAWRERMKLATTLRELVALCVTSDAPAADIARANEEAAKAVATLSSSPRRTFGQAFKDLSGLPAHIEYADRGMMVGRCNPNAPPMRLHGNSDTHALVTVKFGPTHEGIPGHVHGGMIAAAFDQLFGYMQSTQNRGSLTASLTVHYRAPTPLETELRLEATRLRTEGRKTFVSGTLHAREKLCAEAEGLFVEINPEVQLPKFLERKG
jgi:acyl-coenzyme A thioesterase PaaI-like protein